METKMRITWALLPLGFLLHCTSQTSSSISMMTTSSPNTTLTSKVATPTDKSVSDTTTSVTKTTIATHAVTTISGPGSAPAYITATSGAALSTPTTGRSMAAPRQDFTSSSGTTTQTNLHPTSSSGTPTQTTLHPTSPSGTHTMAETTTMTTTTTTTTTTTPPNIFMFFMSKINDKIITNINEKNQTCKDLKAMCQRLMSQMHDANCTLTVRGIIRPITFDSVVITGEVNNSVVQQYYEEITRKQSDNMTLIAILASCGALLAMIVGFALYALYHRKSYRKNHQQHLTEEMQTVENGYHDNPTLEVMEVQPEMQEKKVALNGEFNDSWIVPIDNLLKEDMPDEEDTHL